MASIRIRTRAVVAALLISLAFVPSLHAEEPAEDAVPMELTAPAPPWWTPTAMGEAKAAAAAGALYNPVTGETVPTRSPVGIPIAPDYLFIRPGALLLTEAGFLCTSNFIYSNLAEIGTAGHCVEQRRETVFILAAPTIPLVTALGTVGSFRDGGVGNDWALIDIDPQWAPFVDPNVAYVGGPSCTTWTPALEAGKHVGHGIQTGLVASVPRVSAITAFTGRSFTAVGEISSGDSGGPMLEVLGALPGCAAGGAVGVITHCLTVTGIECLPILFGTDIRVVPATVTPGLDPA